MNIRDASIAIAEIFVSDLISYLKMESTENALQALNMCEEHTKATINEYFEVSDNAVVELLWMNLGLAMKECVEVPPKCKSPEFFSDFFILRCSAMLYLVSAHQQSHYPDTIKLRAFTVN